MDIEYIAKGLSPKARKNGAGWKTCCPAHDDNNPSLSLKQEGDQLLWYCFAGCEQDAVRQALAKTGLYDWQPSNDSRENYRRGKEKDDFLALMKKAIWEGEKAEELDKQWMSVAQLASEALLEPEQHSLLGPFKRSQVGWLAAPAGVGKSMFALALAGAISQGSDFGAWKGTGEHTRARIVDAELTARDLLQRVKLLGHENSPMMFDTYGKRMGLDIDGFRLGHPDDQAWIQHTCKDSDVIVIDNVTFTLDPAPGYGIFAPETINQMRPLFNWIKAAGKLLILVDHTNAEGKLSGSMNKQRLADWVAFLEPDTCLDSMELAFTLKFDKYRGEGRPRRDTAFSMDSLGAWTNNEVIPLADQILEMLQNGAKIKEAAQDLGCSEVYVKKISAQRGNRR
ncbi:MAG: AAA family ATPase [Gammaproteobacteria bacterium]|nr:AAA family ATPase [Gammaproteobacteria bacterium]